ncbi:hypothetical protein [uncultured Arcticibacterium sp.]|uniref:hypothetical protein n=1 Tax=uncultured Arcticibacterium sp. TaxID=2173042 RepID=UPI0030F66C2E
MNLRLSILRVSTLIYIAFPLIPFFLGWVRLEYGIPMLGLLFYGGFNYVKSLDFKERFVLRKRDLLIGLAILSVWLLFSGAGGMGYQVSDHVKNNTLAKELSNLSWPLQYDVDGEKMYLSHYLSFYIVGPFVAGFIGYPYAQLVVFLWTTLGVFLGVFWLARAAGGFNWRFFLFFIFFGGISVFSFIFKYEGGFITEIVKRVNEHGFVFWMNSWDVIPLNYLHITDMLYWTPQHFIPAILGIGILLNDSLIDKNISFTPFLLCLLVMWSPLILVGIFPYFVFVLFQNRFKDVFNITNLVVGPIIFLFLASYLLAIESGDLVKHFIFTAEGAELREQILVFFYFLFFEVVVWVLPIYFIKRGKWKNGEKPLFIVLSLVLFTIPLYRFGLWNDWCNRVSMPSLVLLSVFAYKAFMASKKLKRVWMITLLVLASNGPMMDMVGSLKYSGYKPKFRPPYEQEVLSLPEICVAYPITQFVAAEDSFFFKYLAKKPNK